MVLTDSRPIVRHVIDGLGSDDGSVKDGVRWLVRTARAAGGDRGAIFVATAQQVEHLGRAIGAPAAALLRSKRQVTSRGMVFDLLLEKDLGFPYRHGPVLAVWVDTATMERIEGLGIQSVCAIPWNYHDLDGWKASRNPIELRASELSQQKQRRGAMSEVQQEPDWWLATDGRWYPPERHPNYRPPTVVAPPDGAPFLHPQRQSAQPGSQPPDTQPPSETGSYHVLSMNAFVLERSARGLETLLNGVPRTQGWQLVNVVVADDDWLVVFSE